MKESTMKMALAVLVLATASVPLLAEESYANTVGMEFVTVEGSSFQMGMMPEEDGAIFSDHVSRRWFFSNGNEMTLHQVTLSSFAMAATPVTQAQWQAVMGTNPSYFTDGSDAPQRPVEQVTWFDALVFCNRLSVAEGLTPVYTINGSTDPDHWGAVPYLEWDAMEVRGGNVELWNTVRMNLRVDGYRLPTAAEWEYAARGGKESQGYHFAGSNNLDEVAWHQGNSNESPQPVAQKQPNELGLYDMSGNVFEWCWNWYEDHPGTAQTNPTGPETGEKRVVRGGAWSNMRSSLFLCGYQHNSFPVMWFSNYGFRVARTL